MGSEMCIRDRLGELEDCAEASVAGVAVCYDGSKIVDVGSGLALVGAESSSLIVVSSVVQLLGFEETLYLVGHGVIRVVPKVWRDFIGGCEDGRARPAGNVQDLLVRCLLGHLDWINRTH